MKKLIPLLFLVLSVSFADASGQSSLRRPFKSKSVWWYRNTIINIDGDALPGSQTVDSIKQKNSPGSDYSTIRPVFIHTFDCNDQDAAVYTLRQFYADANGDGYGENPANTAMLCNAKSPAGYADSIVPQTNFYLTNYGPVIKNLWWCSLENSQINGSKYNDILASSFINDARALNFTGYYWPGGVDGNRIVYLAGDTNYLKPLTPNGGFNCNWCDENSLNCCVKMPVSFFPQEIEFCRQLNVPTALGADVEYYDSTGWIAALYYANRKVGVKWITNGQETSNTYNNCKFCGNGSLYAAAVTPIVSTQKRNCPGALRILDCEQLKSSNQKNSFNDVAATISGFDAVRVYWPWHQLMNRFPPTPIGVSLSAQLQKDSIDKAVESLPTRASWYHSKFNLPIAITEAPWMGDGFMPFKDLWLDVYGSAQYMFKVIDMAQTPNNVALNMIWKLDNFVPASNYEYDVTKFFGDYFSHVTDQIVYGPVGTYCRGSINNDGHGILLVLNPNASPIACDAVLVNGFYRAVISIQSVSSSSLNGSVTTSLTTVIPGYSFSEITF